MRIRTICEICGNEYVKTNGKSKYCSDACKKEAARRRYQRDKDKRTAQVRAWREEHPNYQKEWLKNHPHYGRDRSRKARGTVIYQRVCTVCGNEFETPFPRATTCSTGCSKLGKAYRHNIRLSRLKGNGKVDGGITIDKLIERDDGVCHICGGKVNMGDITHKDGYGVIGHNYPTIDHVIPVSKGGTHTWDNVKLAHMICNSRKGSF